MILNQKDENLSNELKKELNFFPKIIQTKKLEKSVLLKEVNSLKEKYTSIQTELEKIKSSINAIEQEFTLVITKNDKIKSSQKLIINSINNDKSFIINEIINDKANNKIRDILFIFFNYENEFKDELKIFLDENNNELTSLLISSYSYLKMLKNDFPKDYEQRKNRINKLISELKSIKEINDAMPIYLIVNYIQNIFKILDNNESMKKFESKTSSLNKKKDQLIIKYKILEEKKKEKENKINIINEYIGIIHSIIEKNKLLVLISNNKDKIMFKKEKLEIGTKENQRVDISCPMETDISQINKSVVKSKISCLNFNLTDINWPPEKITTKNTIDSFDNMNEKLKKLSALNYSSINDIKKDINNDFLHYKNHSLYISSLSSIKMNNIHHNKIKINKKGIKKKDDKNKDFKKKINNIKEKNEGNVIINNSTNIEMNSVKCIHIKKMDKMNKYHSNDDTIKLNSLQENNKKFNNNGIDKIDIKNKEGKSEKVKIIPYPKGLRNKINIEKKNENKKKLIKINIPNSKMKDINKVDKYISSFIEINKNNKESKTSKIKIGEYIISTKTSKEKKKIMIKNNNQANIIQQNETSVEKKIPLHQIKVYKDKNNPKKNPIDNIINKITNKKISSSFFTNYSYIENNNNINNNSNNNSKKQEKVLINLNQNRYKSAIVRESNNIIKYINRPQNTSITFHKSIKKNNITKE